ncbi:MAG: hypothetical protein FWG87_04765 [Defluviitaleaceae bacterium]|nr:hypothetical protein [Defluviitaleaceae bacterium]
MRCYGYLNIAFVVGDLQVFVGDGFIRPEVTSLCVNGRYPPRIVERAYLGADKSAPYKNLQAPSGLTNDLQNADLKAIQHGFKSNGTRIFTDYADSFVRSLKLTKHKLREFLIKQILITTPDRIRENPLNPRKSAFHNSLQNINAIKIPSRKHPNQQKNAT